MQITLPASNQELAAHIGTVRELVSRNLSRLQSEGLIQMDANKYTNMLTDLVMGDPSWAKLDFLERETDQVAGPEGVKNEISFLTQEKADLAGELEKAQNLLRL